jgi:hypothetical protein
VAVHILCIDDWMDDHHRIHEAGAMHAGFGVLDSPDDAVAEALHAQKTG